jgi:hypothetical protein
MRNSLKTIWSQCNQLRKQYNVDAPTNRAKLDDKERRRIQGLGYTETPAR